MALSYSVQVAAAESGLSVRTIRNAIAEGRLKALRVGKRLLVTPEDLIDFLHGRISEVRRDGHEQ